MTPTLTVSVILERYASGERSFASSDIDAEVHDFNNTNLANADFAHSFIVASFRNANLAGADFSFGNVKTCDFSGANLHGARFVGAAIDGAVFHGANLTGALFEGASEQGHIYGPNEFPPTTV